MTTPVVKALDVAEEIYKQTIGLGFSPLSVCIGACITLRQMMYLHYREEGYSHTVAIAFAKEYSKALLDAHARIAIESVNSSNPLREKLMNLPKLAIPASMFGDLDDEQRELLRQLGIGD